VWALVSVVLIAIGSYTNLTFLFIIVPNILIAIIQEIRAKRTVEKLSVTTEPRATVIRDGKLCEIKVRDIVVGDVMKIEMGKQVLSDSVVLSGFAEANESMLTGESDAIEKREGDTVLAGSYLVSGSIYVKVIRVGRENYIHKIESAAKDFKAPASNLFRDLNKLIRYIGIFMVPMTAAMAITNYLDSGKLLYTSIEKTSGSVIGMIPAGMYLLITLTLTLSVIKLGKKKTLVQDMYSIEMLASADVLCLDKTGTITDGTMSVTAFESLAGMTDEYLTGVIAAIEGAEDSINNTSRALIERFGTSERAVVGKIPFSSERKYSAVEFEDGVFAIGAPGFVPCDISYELSDKIKERAANGERVLVLAKLDELEGRGRAIAMIALADNIRPSAKETIANFQSQGVSIKIISGDHAKTVSTIAGRVGVMNAHNYISCENLTDEELCAAAESYTVFGRVTPEQKVLLVKTLKANGHTVAMTGDGVNDTLALKESNCAIAMADGSEVARKVSQIVLMNSDFSTLPDVVKEGRRCINNVRNSSVLFLMKTVFVICLSIFAVCVPGVLYPFEPKQFMLLEMFVIGISSFLLAIEPNYERVEGSFIDTVVIKSIPSALVLFVPTLVILLLGRADITLSSYTLNAVATVVVTVVGFVNLLALCRPFTKWRVGVCIAVGVGLITTALVSVFAGYIFDFIPVDVLGLRPATHNMVFLLGMLGLGMSLAGILHISGISEKMINFAMEKRNKKRNK
ncbi:MAG: HAD-IC family P-type ATPase, partial [Clostridia bacterium]|nr:HAD-IC family P-type ATPase [Clostridia bacterium]